MDVIELYIGVSFRRYEVLDGWKGVWFSSLDYMSFEVFLVIS